MSTVSLTWIDEQRYLGVDSTGHSVVLSKPDDVGAKPSDVLLLALAGCVAFDVVEIIHKRRVPLHALRVTVSGEQATDPPWRYTTIHLHLDVTAPGLQRSQLERAMDLALNKYCSVRASLHPEIEVSYDVALS